jgi:AraC-like DNA-binding protein
MKIDLASVIFLFGVAQGLFLIFYLLLGKNNFRQTKYFLVFFIFVLSYDLFETFLSFHGIRLITSTIFPNTLIFTMGTHLYLIFKTGFIIEDLPLRQILKCYLPAIIDGSIRVLLFAVAINPFYTPAYISENFASINAIFSTISRASMVLVYWLFFVLTVIEFRHFEENFEKSGLHFSETDLGFSKRWLKLFLLFALLGGLIWSVIILGVIFTNQQNNLVLYYPIEVLALMLLYLIGFAAYHRIQIVYVNEKINSQQYLESLSKEEIDEIKAALEKVMKVDKIYLDPELTISKLSSHLGFPARKISSVLNRHLQTGFNEYVNQYRVDEVKEQLLNTDTRKTSTIAIAYNCGFNSLATFQRVFKNVTGITPKQFVSKNSTKQ